MKYLILSLIFLSCSSTPKNQTMADCKHAKDNYWICKPIPEHVVREPVPPREMPHSNSFRY